MSSGEGASIWLRVACAEAYSPDRRRRRGCARVEGELDERGSVASNSAATSSGSRRWSAVCGWTRAVTLRSVASERRARRARRHAGSRRPRGCCASRPPPATASGLVLAPVSTTGPREPVPGEDLTAPLEEREKLLEPFLASAIRRWRDAPTRSPRPTARAPTRPPPRRSRSSRRTELIPGTRAPSIRPSTAYGRKSRSSRSTVRSQTPHVTARSRASQESLPLSRWGCSTPPAPPRPRAAIYTSATGTSHQSTAGNALVPVDLDHHHRPSPPRPSPLQRIRSRRSNAHGSDGAERCGVRGEIERQVARGIAIAVEHRVTRCGEAVLRPEAVEADRARQRCRSS